MMKKYHRRAVTGLPGITPGCATNQLGCLDSGMALLVVRITESQLICVECIPTQALLRGLYMCYLSSVLRTTPYIYLNPILKMRKQRSMEVEYLPKIAEQILIHFSGPVFPHL